MSWTSWRRLSVVSRRMCRVEACKYVGSFEIRIRIAMGW